MQANDATTNDARRVFVSDIFAHTELLAAPVFEGEAAAGARTRPNLKVQDGCNNRCSFCVIPSVRGQSRSLPLADVIREVQALVAAGYREVVISGINLGRWGRDLVWGARPRAPFADFVRAILADTELEKLRLSSIEPMDWTAGLISLMASSPRIAKHAHVPMQSASDRILRRMHRKYRPWHYREKIEQIRAAAPTAAIGADVMVGFPGETDADFEETRRMIEDLPFTYLHVFTYSSRPGTPSAAMSNQVSVHIARQRNKILRDLAAEKKLAFMRSFIGKEIQAITLGRAADPPPTESSSRPDIPLSSRAEPCDSPSESHGAVERPCVSPTRASTECLTDNYLKLHLQGNHRPNRWVTVRVAAARDGSLLGTATT